MIEGDSKVDGLATYTFDQVFDSDSTQEQVYETVKGSVGDVMAGINATIFAYG